MHTVIRRVAGRYIRDDSSPFRFRPTSIFLRSPDMWSATAVRAGLVGRAEYWQWSSLWRLSRENEESSEILSQWPMERPKDWIQFVNEPERESELEDMRSSAQRGRPYGSEDWVIKIAKQLGLGSTMNPRGRPKRS